MGYRRIGLAAVAALALMVIVEAAPAAAASAAASGMRAGAAIGAERIDLPAMHRHRTQSFYCYPKNYWWFYRPYTTGQDGHARCMPYFHYLGPSRGRGGKADPYIK